MPKTLPYLTIRGAADLIGVSQGTVRNQVYAGAIPHVLTRDGKPLIREADAAAYRDRERKPGRPAKQG